MFEVRVRNNFCAADYTASGQVGGLVLEENSLWIPHEVYPVIKDMTQHPENKIQSVDLWVEVFLNLSTEQVGRCPGLRPYLLTQGKCDIPQQFIGPDPLDQRPAVTSSRLFNPLVGLISNVWGPHNFERYQDGNHAIMKVKVHASDELAELILNLVGYPVLTLVSA